MTKECCPYEFQSSARFSCPRIQLYLRHIKKTHMNPPLENARLFDIIAHQIEHSPQETSLAYKKNGHWISLSSQEVSDQAHLLSAGLLQKGFVPGDRIAIVSSTNRPEWNIIDLGVLQIGCIDVPIYPTITEKEYEFVLNDSGCRLAFVSDNALYSKLTSIQSSCPNLEAVYMMDEETGIPHWKGLMTDDIPAAYERVKPYKDKVDNESLATLIYTSGTTGVPKGVMLSHKNIVSNVLGSALRLPIETGAKALSFLPLCHIFERMLIYLYALKGVQIFYAESLDTIGDNMKEVKPQIFSAVPRLLEKVYGKIMAKGDDLTGIKRVLFFWAVKLAKNYEYYGKNGALYELKLKIARKLIFSKWKEALGGEVQLAASGSAALSPQLARIFTAAGIPVMEGYGLTETSPVISVNEIENDGFRFGTTGRPIDKVEVKIAEDGEILARGPNIMMGYYKRPEITAEVIDSEGWFHTGDIGELEEGQYLKITDRKKEIFKTSGGKYIAPQIMENVFKQNKYIEQIIVLGENKKHPSALIVPNFENLKDYCAEGNMSFKSIKDTLADERINSLYHREIEKCNAEFNRWEKVKKFELIDREFSIDGGELTPTMKLKRKAIFEKYKDLIEALYED